MSEKNECNILVTSIGQLGIRKTNYAVFEEEYEIFPNDKRESMKKHDFSFQAIAAAGPNLDYAYGFDEMLILGTDKSAWAELEKSADGENNITNQVDKWSDENRKSSFDILEDKLEHNLGIKQVKICEIKAGRCKSENKYNIEAIKKILVNIIENLSDDIDIIFTIDVSLGIRSFSLYTNALANYLSALMQRRIIVKIAYGMADAQIPVENEEGMTGGIENSDRIEPKKVAPISDLSDITEISSKWTSAIKEFYSNGSVSQIIMLLTALLKNIDEENVKEYIKNTIKIFSDFHFAINVNNLKLLQNTVNNIGQLFDGEKEKLTIESLPYYVGDSLVSVFNNLYKRFGKFESEYTRNMYALAKWYLEQGRFGDAAIMVQEGMITHVLEKYVQESKNLLDKKLSCWNKNKNNLIFDYEVRKAIRESVYDEENDWWDEWPEWNAWLKEYYFIRDYVRNSSRLMVFQNNYNMSDIFDDDIASEGDKYACIKENMEILLKKVDEELNCKNQIKNRLDFLINQNIYDVFISYRRSYNSVDENDGVLLVAAIEDYLVQNGMRVFVDKSKLYGKSGNFSDMIRKELSNSRCCLVILGKGAFSRDYSDGDEYYKEIILAQKKKKNIFVVCMQGFENGRFGAGVEEKKELMYVARGTQRIGSKDTDIWGYNQIYALRECILSEILKADEENNEDFYCNRFSESALETVSGYVLDQIMKEKCIDYTILCGYSLKNNVKNIERKLKHIYSNYVIELMAYYIRHIYGDISLEEFKIILSKTGRYTVDDVIKSLQCAEYLDYAGDLLKC